MVKLQKIYKNRLKWTQAQEVRKHQHQHYAHLGKEEEDIPIMLIPSHPSKTLKLSTLCFDSSQPKCVTLSTLVNIKG